MDMDFFLGEDNLLERVDEYTLYCHYLEFEPEIRVNYSSPLRADDRSPSFGIYPSRKPNREYFWKDSGDRGDSGDIFKLVQKLYGYSSTAEALARIKSDFGLGALVNAREKVIKNFARHRTDADIRIRAREFRSEDLTFWKQFNIAEALLKRYRVSPLFCYWVTPAQRAPFFAPAFSYVYRIYERYQLYFPTKDKGMKFRGDLQDHHVLGLQQLTLQADTLIITKSYKDVMCLRSFGYEAISPRSENVPMPEGFFSWADQYYKRKLVLFDNDGKHRAEWYPYLQIEIPKSTGSKDISDFTRDHGPQQAAELLRQLIK